MAPTVGLPLVMFGKEMLKKTRVPIFRYVPDWLTRVHPVAEPPLLRTGVNVPPTAGPTLAPMYDQHRQLPLLSDTNVAVSPAAVVMLAPPGRISVVALCVSVSAPLKRTTRSL